MNAIAPPPRSRALNEALSWVEFPRLLLNSPALLAAPRGQGERVAVFPGFGAGDASTAALRQYLAYLGYEVSGWRMGRNGGDVPALIDMLTEGVAREYDRTGEALNLIGWSLGGYLAREVARELPHAVTQVITMGSPIVGGPKYTQVASAFGDSAMLDWIEREIELRDQTPLRVPVTAIYSKLDGVVAWEACIDTKHDDVEHIEVTTTHIGLGFNPDVYRIIARKLAA